MTTLPDKIAHIYGAPGLCSDDGRALTYSWKLFLHDHGGKGGVWHGGPYFPRHCSHHTSENAARKTAESLGYKVVMVREG